jgi:transcriptional regulator with XRE-family HTH domain
VSDEQPPASFAEALERLRKARGLKPRELARGLGVYEGEVSRWRHGGGVSVRNVRKVADFFGVDPEPLEHLAGYHSADSSQRPARDVELEHMAERWIRGMQGVPRKAWAAVFDAELQLMRLFQEDARSNTAADSRSNTSPNPVANPPENEESGRITATYSTTRERSTFGRMLAGAAQGS